MKKLENTHDCATCMNAEWRLATCGKLSRTGIGWCTVKHYEDGWQVNINRHYPIKNCPLFTLIGSFYLKSDK